MVADLRLDNREELHRELGGAVETDADLLGAGWRRWGTALAAHLAGDFAFVLWDEVARRGYAARDAMGARPLYFRATDAGVAIATEIESLLVIGSSRPPVDDQMVLEFLRDRFSDHRRTFFSGITRLPPGHFLDVWDGGMREDRYFVLPSRSTTFADVGACAEEFLVLLRRSVRDRMDSCSAVACELSGGLDSSAITCLADRICRAEPQRPPLRTISAVFPGLACDETPYIEAVASQIACPSDRVAVLAVEAPEERDPLSAFPVVEPQPGFLAGLQQAAACRGVRVLLSGVGGDHLMSEFGVFGDLLAHGRLAAFAREYAGLRNYSFRGPFYWFAHALRDLAPPQLAALAGWWMPSRRSRAPRWLGHALRDRWGERPCARDAPQAFSSHAQAWTWHSLTDPRLVWMLEYAELVLARGGVEPRYPFLDSRLASFVLSLPFEVRMPGPTGRALLRSAVRGVVPPQVVARARKADFSVAVFQRSVHEAPWLASVVGGTEAWRATPFVDRGALAALLAGLVGERPGKRGGDWSAVRQAVRLEMWLRKLERTC